MTYRRIIPAVFILLFAVELSRGQSLSTADNELSHASVFDKHQNPSPPTALPVPPVSAGSIQRHTQLRRGRDQEIAVFLCQPTPRVPVCDTHFAHFRNSVVPVSLQMEPADGFTIRYGDGRHYRSAAQGHPDLPADKGLIFVKVRASNKLAPGQYTLKGTLTFRSLGHDDFLQPQSVPVAIPLTLVAHDAKVSQTDWPYGSHPGEAFKNFMVGLVAVPCWAGIILFAAAYCTFADCN